ncbi:FtsX-like permease family protein [Mediterraneibacter gnavus]|uniref:FtsX-like permease family protein n=1 Tax=Mediterraneibacter gnavus TaxID=33038 RepID=UPI00232F0438|nr:FtsX-like permease family protein [Mediterraneibacter gnavus]MDB8710459.1 FtsX-like permease family protein [Mediterraneibacter gnavus]MDB8714043.1 FtsX-like permease family protein [Mediterraneibacter gnavus]
MKQIIRLAWSYLKYYKKQTMALFLGIVLSCALFTGIGSLQKSGNHAARENARTKSGDWHYTMRCDTEWFEEFKKTYQPGEKEQGYCVEKTGVLTMRKVTEEPYEIELDYAEEGYLSMMGRIMKEGRYPVEEGEAALDEFALRNLNIPREIGTTFILDGETFTLCGIVSEQPSALVQRMQVFVNPILDYGTNGTFLYVKFDESKDIYRQMSAFADTFGISKKKIAANWELLEWLKNGVRINAAEVVKTGILHWRQTGFPYIWGNLDEKWNLKDKAVLAAIGVFGTFVIYSLFQVSVRKRMSQYSVMQTLGMESKRTFGVLTSELWMIFAVAYPVGCVLGNAAAWGIYQKIGSIFVRTKGNQHTNMYVAAETAREAAQAGRAQASAFQVSGETIFFGAIFLLCLLTLVSLILVRRMEKLTLREMIAKEGEAQTKRRKIYSLKRKDLTGVLTKKFMFSRKKTFIGIILSLSVGSVLFLGTAYLTENAKINNELTFKADDGLGSDIQVYEDSDSLPSLIPKACAEQMEKISGLESVRPVRYMAGELALSADVFHWTEYYMGSEKPEENILDADSGMVEKFNGRLVRKANGEYGLKVNIYGYDDSMLNELNDYLLEGEIDPEKMREEDTVILATLMDGQGNYDGISVSPGDALLVRTPKTEDTQTELLKFQGEDSLYQSSNLQVQAVVSRTLARVDQFYGDGAASIIMTNEQMQKYFGVNGYRAISIALKENADAGAVTDEIRKVVSGVSDCVVKDYTEQIKVQNFYLNQKMLFFYGIALVLLVISLLHIMNSMQYLVAARKHEFGILRAMGITDSGFRIMLLKEGLRYGVYSSIVMVVLYLVVQKVLYYFMTHVFLYLHPKSEIQIVPVLIMSLVNLSICAAAVLISGQSVLKEQVVDVIRE